MDFEKLSKKVSYILRHAPWEYELELDEEGWASLDQLLMGLHLDPFFRYVEQEQLREMIRMSPKIRHEIRGTQIRALYGHSISKKVKKKCDSPPKILFHGTISRYLPSIQKEGLKPMGRQFVHLSTDPETARNVALRKGKNVMILQILAHEAASHGVRFYIGNEQVWLADYISTSWIIFPKFSELSNDDKQKCYQEDE